MSVKYDASMTQYHGNIATAIKRMCRHDKTAMKLVKDASPAPLREHLKKSYKYNGAGDASSFYQGSPKDMKIEFSGESIILSWSQVAKFIRDNPSEIFDDYNALPVQPERAAEIADFNYSELDADTAKALKGCEAIIKQETSGYFTMLGAKFKEAQELLANHGKGTFERWYSSIGFKRQTVYNLIQRYEFSSSPTIGGHEEIFEALPVTLSYEISKPTAPPELVDKVLSGDITSNSEYKKELEQIQEEARKAKERADEAEKKAAFWSKTSAETSKENQQLRADRVSAMNRADNAERKNSELEQRVKELENRPVDVAVQTDDSLLKEKDQEISELKEQIERMSDKTVKSFVIRMSPDEYEQLIKALEQADDRLKSIIKNARILKI